MGELGDKVADLKKLFDQYASRDGKPDTLSKKELKQMIKDKMAPGLKVCF
ncbi:MAG: protein S100 [Cetobacterium sp.]